MYSTLNERYNQARFSGFLDGGAVADGFAFFSFNQNPTTWTWRLGHGLQKPLVEF
jgi:hypothetical protein